MIEKLTYEDIIERTLRIEEKLEELKSLAQWILAILIGAIGVGLLYRLHQWFFSGA